ncbi:MAG: methyltransferase domain-containing protein [Thermoguttaceae bacterium]
MSKSVPSAFHLRFLTVGCVIIVFAAGMRFFLYQRAAERKTDSSPLPQPVVDAPFITTPDDIVDKMLELAQVGKDDLVYDLGCGDGRIVVAAAKKYGCRAVGFDIDPERVQESLDNVRKNQVEHLVTIQQEDIFDLELNKADVVTLYLLPGMNLKLIPQLEKLKPGARIVSHDFDLGSIQPDKILRLFCQEDAHQHVLYLWVAPLRKK